MNLGPWLKPHLLLVSLSEIAASFEEPHGAVVTNDHHRIHGLNDGQQPSSSDNALDQFSRVYRGCVFVSHSILQCTDLTASYNCTGNECLIRPVALKPFLTPTETTISNEKRFLSDAHQDAGVPADLSKVLQAPGLGPGRDLLISSGSNSMNDNSGSQTDEEALKQQPTGSFGSFYSGSVTVDFDDPSGDLHLRAPPPSMVERNRERNYMRGAAAHRQITSGSFANPPANPVDQIQSDPPSSSSLQQVPSEHQKKNQIAALRFRHSLNSPPELFQIKKSPIPDGQDSVYLIRKATSSGAFALDPALSQLPTLRPPTNKEQLETPEEWLSRVKLPPHVRATSSGLDLVQAIQDKVSQAIEAMLAYPVKLTSTALQQIIEVPRSVSQPTLPRRLEEEIANVTDDKSSESPITLSSVDTKPSGPFGPIESTTSDMLPWVPVDSLGAAFPSWIIESLVGSYAQIFGDLIKTAQEAFVGLQVFIDAAMDQPIPVTANDVSNFTKKVAEAFRLSPDQREADGLKSLALSIRQLPVLSPRVPSMPSPSSEQMPPFSLPAFKVPSLSSKIRALSESNANPRAVALVYPKADPTLWKGPTGQLEGHGFQGGGATTSDTLPWLPLDAILGGLPGFFTGKLGATGGMIDEAAALWQKGSAGIDKVAGGLFAPLVDKVPGMAPSAPPSLPGTKGIVDNKNSKGEDLTFKINDIKISAGGLPSSTSPRIPAPPERIAEPTRPPSSQQRLRTNNFRKYESRFSPQPASRSGAGPHATNAKWTTSGYDQHLTSGAGPAARYGSRFQSPSERYMSPTRYELQSSDYSQAEGDRNENFPEQNGAYSQQSFSGDKVAEGLGEVVFFDDNLDSMFANLFGRIANMMDHPQSDWFVDNDYGSKSLPGREHSHHSIGKTRMVPVNPIRLLSERSNDTERENHLIVIPNTAWMNTSHTLPFLPLAKLRTSPTITSLYLVGDNETTEVKLTASFPSPDIDTDDPEKQLLHTMQQQAILTGEGFYPAVKAVRNSGNISPALNSYNQDHSKVDAAWSRPNALGYNSVYQNQYGENNQRGSDPFGMSPYGEGISLDSSALLSQANSYRPPFGRSNQLTPLSSQSNVLAPPSSHSSPQHPFAGRSQSALSLPPLTIPPSHRPGESLVPGATRTYLKNAAAGRINDMTLPSKSVGNFKYGERAQGNKPSEVTTAASNMSQPMSEYDEKVHREQSQYAIEAMWRTFRQKAGGRKRRFDTGGLPPKALYYFNEMTPGLPDQWSYDYNDDGDHLMGNVLETPLYEAAASVDDGSSYLGSFIRNVFNQNWLGGFKADNIGANEEYNDLYPAHDEPPEMMLRSLERKLAASPPDLLTMRSAVEALMAVINNAVAEASLDAIKKRDAILKSQRAAARGTIHHTYQQDDGIAKAFGLDHIPHSKKEEVDEYLFDTQHHHSSADLAYQNTLELLRSSIDSRAHVDELDTTATKRRLFSFSGIFGELFKYLPNLNDIIRPGNGPEEILNQTAAGLLRHISSDVLNTGPKIKTNEETKPADFYVNPTDPPVDVPDTNIRPGEYIEDGGYEPSKETEKSRRYEKIQEADHYNTYDTAGRQNSEGIDSLQRTLPWPQSTFPGALPAPVHRSTGGPYDTHMDRHQTNKNYGGTSNDWQMNQNFPIRPPKPRFENDLNSIPTRHNHPSYSNNGWSVSDGGFAPWPVATNGGPGSNRWVSPSDRMTGIRTSAGSEPGSINENWSGTGSWGALREVKRPMMRGSIR